MTISYNFTRDDHIHFNMYHIAHSPSLKKNRQVATLFTPILFALIGVFEYLKHPKFDAVIFFGGAALLSAFLFPKYYDWSTKRRMNKILDEGKDVSLSDRTTLTLKPEGLSIEGEKSSGIVKWNGIERVEASASHTFLYTGAVNALVIPNTAFESVAEREKFIELVMQYRENAAGISAVLA